MQEPSLKGGGFFVVCKIPINHSQNGGTQQ